MAARRKKKQPIIIVSALLGIVAGIAAAKGPWRVWFQQTQELKKAETQLSSLQKYEESRKADNNLDNPIRREEEARRRGFVPPGEQPIK